MSVSHSHSDCLVRLNFLKLDVSSLFCYLLCELIGSVFAKFCVHEWSEQAVQSRPVEPVLLQYQWATLSQVEALALMPSPAWGPPDTLTQLMKKANTSLLACTGIECKLNQTPGDSNAIKSGLLNNDSNWLWGCREKGSLEANRNLNKDHCATCLCCGTLRTWSWGFHVTSQCLNISYIAFLWK